MSPGRLSANGSMFALPRLEAIYYVRYCTQRHFHMYYVLGEEEDNFYVLRT